MLVVAIISGTPYRNGMEMKYVERWIPSGWETRSGFRSLAYPFHSSAMVMHVSNAFIAKYRNETIICHILAQMTQEMKPLVPWTNVSLSSETVHHEH
jgi:hypothetical protein